DRVKKWAGDNRGTSQTPILLPQDGEELANNVNLIAVSRIRYQEQPPSEAPNPKFTEEDLKQLAEAWKTHDDLSKASPPPPSYSPAVWRLYEETLLRAEQLLRAGDPAAGKLFAALTALGQDLEEAAKLGLAHRVDPLALLALVGETTE